VKFYGQSIGLDSELPELQVHRTCVLQSVHKLHPSSIDLQARLDVRHDVNNRFSNGPFGLVRAPVRVIRRLEASIRCLAPLARRPDIVPRFDEPRRERSVSLSEPAECRRRAEQQRMGEAQPQNLHQHLLVDLQSEPLLLLTRQLLEADLRVLKLSAPLVEPPEMLLQVRRQ
jgi:hypothetical protein